MPDGSIVATAANYEHRGVDISIKASRVLAMVTALQLLDEHHDDVDLDPNEIVEVRYSLLQIALEEAKALDRLAEV